MPQCVHPFAVSGRAEGRADGAEVPNRVVGVPRRGVAAPCREVGASGRLTKVLRGAVGRLARTFSGGRSGARSAEVARWRRGRVGEAKASGALSWLRWTQVCPGANGRRADSEPRVSWVCRGGDMSRDSRLSRDDDMPRRGRFSPNGGMSRGGRVPRGEGVSCADAAWRHKGVPIDIAVLKGGVGRADSEEAGVVVKASGVF
ncbi:hypothetical protein GCM10010171_48470 [Actinokineospora fastidiosa]|uniref:Uncharacterized protein n=1 Tax=Actinokineospora fastidiosa TaxID=1816 RepID=A0A918LHJ2_9PSEU|nr:hypothetical protein GCM10010171_48470 [Actinokineospora fastidiosa]